MDDPKVKPNEQESKAQPSAPATPAAAPAPKAPAAAPQMVQVEFLQPHMIVTTAKDAEGNPVPLQKLYHPARTVKKPSRRGGRPIDTAVPADRLTCDKPLADTLVKTGIAQIIEGGN